MQNIRTDLALEIHEFLCENAEEILGIVSKDKSDSDIKITDIKIETEDASKRTGKPVGNYITVETPDLRFIDSSLYEKICKKISVEIKDLIDKKSDKPVLVVGLGNRAIASDSLGPEVIDRLMITRHLFSYAPQSLTENLGSVCAIAPGVLGITGIETQEIVKGVCEHIKPSLVICIDALCARSIDRICKTIQICNTGISPGGGVGNKRSEISKNTLGVPVLAVGVPTVVDAATITDDTLNLVIDSILKKADTNTPFFKSLKAMDENERYALIKSSVLEFLPDFMTTPKEIDILIKKCAEVLANGINFALHKDITFSDIEVYVS